MPPRPPPRLLGTSPVRQKGAPGRQKGAPGHLQENPWRLLHPRDPLEAMVPRTSLRQGPSIEGPRPGGMREAIESAAPCGVLDGGTSKRSDRSSPILKLQSFFTPPKSLPGRPAFRQTDPRGVPQILFSVLEFLLDRARAVPDYFFSAPEVSKSVPRGFEEACGDLMCAGPSLRPHFGSMFTSKRSPVYFKIKGIL